MGYSATVMGEVIGTRFGRPLKLSKLKCGYLKFDMYVGGVQKNMYVHRFVWEYFNGPIPEGMQVDHVNNIRTDNRLSNLQLLSQKDNLRKSSKLDEQAVEEILQSPLNGPELAKIYGVTKQTIYDVRSGKTWR